MALGWSGAASSDPADWPLRMSDTQVPVQPAPKHGADNEAIYGSWLGLSADEVTDLRKRNVI